MPQGVAARSGMDTWAALDNAPSERLGSLEVLLRCIVQEFQVAVRWRAATTDNP